MFAASPRRSEEGQGTEADSKASRGDGEENLFNSSFDDGPVSETESAEDYRKGGYHWVQIGDVYQDKYLIHRKLGWGQFSTVWLITDLSGSHRNMHKTMALKIIKSAPQYREAAQDEIDLLETVSKASDKLGKRFVVQMLDTFELYGPNGAHLCIAFELMGRTLLSYIRKKGEDVLCRDLKTVKRLTFQMALGLHYLHEECKIVHTDIKPENFLMSRRHPPDSKSLESTTLAHVQSLKRTARSRHDRRPSAESLRNMMTSAAASSSSHQLDLDDTRRLTPTDGKASDFSASRTGSEENHIGPNSPSAFITVPSEPIRPPLLTKQNSTGATTSVAVGTPATQFDIDLLPVPLSRQTSTSTIDHEEAEVKLCDLGNSCRLDRFATSIISTRQYRSPEVILGLNWGTKTDMWSLGCVVFELLTGDYCFDPQAEPESNLTRDEHHLQLMMELLGSIPEAMINEGKNSKDFFDNKGNLRHTKVYGHWGLALLLDRRYGMPEKEARETANALESMLRFNPNDRWSSADLLRSAWLSEEVKRLGLNVDEYLQQK